MSELFVYAVAVILLGAALFVRAWWVSRRHRLADERAERELPRCTACKAKLRTMRQQRRGTCEPCDDAHARQNVVEYRF